MTFEGANPQAEMVGLEKLPGIVNYFIGADPSNWRTNIPTYQKVAYTNVYPGIDLVYYGNQGQLEYDLIVAPGADPTQITLAFDGVEQMAVDVHGDLVLTVPQSSNDATGGDAATLRLHKPVVYQRDEQGEKHLLAGTYVLLASEPSRSASAALHRSETSDPSSLTPHVAFQVAAYDASQPLIIDPVLSWATYLGGSGTDIPQSIAVDQAGQAYVTGYTNSSGFPGTSGSSIQSTYGGGTYDAFVTKLNAAGTALVYATYLGGSGIDVGRGIAVDQAGQAYVTGVIRSTSGFPGITGSSIQSTHAGGVEDAFVTKLNAAGTQLLYSTYLGGSGDDYGSGIAVDQAGNAYVTGFTYSSSDFPGITGSSIQSTHGGGGVEDVFVTKLNAAGTALVYSTYLGGTGKDDGIRIAMDWVGNAYVTGGTTTSSGFPGITASSIQSTNGGGWDGFVAKIQFVMPVSIDIKPGSFPNSINLGSNGVVPVAILGSATFDASQVDPLTVTMADAKVKLKGKGTPMASLQDVNGDGFLDLVVQVSTSTLVLNANDTEAIVEGATVGGTTFRGKDSLRTVP